MIALIAAIDRRRAIGYQNKLLYWLPNDMKRFKALTTGHTIVMGRRTFESLPKGALPNRRNIVLSTSPGLELPGAEVFRSLEEALAACRADEQVYIIGGASLYRQALPLADRLCLTEIEAEAPQADAFFPEIDTSAWQEKSRESHPADEKHPCPPLCFCRLRAEVNAISPPLYSCASPFSISSPGIGICRLMASWKEISVSVRDNPRGCNLSCIMLRR